MVAKKPIIKDPINCAREVMNFSSIELTDRFDKPRFNPDKFIAKLPLASPKMIALLEKINQLDEADYSKEKKVYKHFIFSDLKKGYGAKIIASAFIAAGYTLVMKSQKSKIVIDENILKTEDDSKFAVLSSTALWNTPVTPNLTKEILSVFNARPKNVYGQQVRFIILDSGFKEGIDLFDVKYAHIFEDQLTEADTTQAIGRVTRFCGQKGLEFKSGWKVNAFIYRSYIPTPPSLKKLLGGKEPLLDYLKKANNELEYNVNFMNDITSSIKDAAVDKLLNENINGFSKQKYNYYALAAKIAIPIAAVGLLASILYTRRKRKMEINENLDKMIRRFGKTTGNYPMYKEKFTKKQ